MANDTKALAPIDAFRADLSRMQPEFSKALPPHVSSDKFTRVIMTAVQQNPAILNCDKRSLFGACMRSAQAGLLPDGREAALVSYRTKNGELAQFMPMIAGILKMARNSGEISTLAAELVYAHDKFTYRVVNGKPDMLHEPVTFGDRGEILGAYACAVLKDGSTMIEVMSRADIEQVRAASRAKDSGPWVSWWGEMAKKTVLRRLSKRLPSSTDREDRLDQAIRSDDDLYDLGAQTAPVPSAPESAAPQSSGAKRPRGLQQVVEQGAVIEGEASEVPPGSDPQDPGPGPDDVPL